MMIDVVGFSGSALFIASATSRSVVRLRLIGVLGAVAFAAYGWLLGAWPIVISNLLTLGVHAYHLVRLRLDGRVADTGGRRIRRRAGGTHPVSV